MDFSNLQRLCRSFVCSFQVGLHGLRSAKSDLLILLLFFLGALVFLVVLVFLVILVFLGLLVFLVVLVFLELLVSLVSLVFLARAPSPACRGEHKRVRDPDPSPR